MLEANKVYHMDCLEGMRLMAEQGLKVDCVITDPPYEYRDYSAGNKGFDEKQENIEFIKSISNGFDVKTVFSSYRSVLKKVNIFCFCNSIQLGEITQWGKAGGYQVNVLAWHKGGRPFGVTYLHDLEFIVHIRETGAPFNGMYKSRVIDCMSRRENGHPTEKPLKVVSRLVEYGSNPGDLVLDSYMGSFTTAVACHRLGRRYIGFEIDAHHYANGSKRLAAETAQVSMLDFMRKR